MPTFSAYMSVYNDVDILARVLPPLKGRIDELVIVDGGYDWMDGYLRGIGKDPSRSDAGLYRLVEESGIPYRCINQVWKNEIEKRTAGYAACTTDYVFRVDADEVSFFRDDVIERFVASGGVVAEMELPMYDSPGRIQCAGDGKPSPRQGFLFDRRKVDAAQHLHYLWLVLTADQLERHANERHPVFPDAVAFNAHLSNWRTPEGGVQRAAFYVMNYMRSHGAPFIPDLRHRPMNDFAAFFEYIPHAAFNSAMKRSEVINGQHKLDGGHLCPSPLTSEQEATFAGLYEAFLASTKAFNRAALEADQTFINGQSMCFHLTGLDDARLADGVGFRFSCPIASSNAVLHEVFADAPYTVTSKLDVQIDGARIKVATPRDRPRGGQEIRRMLTVTVWAAAQVWFGSFRLETDLG